MVEENVGEIHVDIEEDLDVQAKIWHDRIEALCKGTAYYLKEHPRAVAHLSRLAEMLKTDIDNFIFKGKVPLSNASSAEEAHNSLAQKQTERMKEVKVNADEIKKNATSEIVDQGVHNEVPKAAEPSEITQPPARERA